MIGPLSGDEGIAVKNYAKTQPDITFINGSSGAQATTLVDPAPNFYRFNTEGAQWMVGPRRARARQGLQEGVPRSPRTTASRTRRCRASWPSYCAKGGKVVDKAWVPLGTKDYASVDRQDPEGHRRAARRARRLRRGELPHPVRAGRRQQADGRRLDHGRPDGAQLQGQAPRVAARHGVGRADGRLDRHAGVEEVRRRLQGFFAQPFVCSNNPFQHLLRPHDRRSRLSSFIHDNEHSLQRRSQHGTRLPVHRPHWPFQPRQSAQLLAVQSAVFPQT